MKRKVMLLSILSFSFVNCANKNMKSIYNFKEKVNENGDDALDILVKTNLPIIRNTNFLNYAIKKHLEFKGREVPKEDIYYITCYRPLKAYEDYPQVTIAYGVGNSHDKHQCSIDRRRLDDYLYKWKSKNQTV